jgi:DNA-binding transcriptional ArsR family regulator
MNQLNPTLWRTCRALAGRTRMFLFRALLEQPGRNVTQLAQAVGIGKSDASQELRRLQSRGLLQANRIGPFLHYRLTADPQVPSAAPLLESLKRSFGQPSPLAEDAINRIARGLSCTRRLAIARALANRSMTLPELSATLNVPPGHLWPHLRILSDAGIVTSKGRKWSVKPAGHPLTRALTQLIRNTA